MLNLAAGNFEKKDSNQQMASQKNRDVAYLPLRQNGSPCFSTKTWDFFLRIFAHAHDESKQLQVGCWGDLLTGDEMMKTVNSGLFLLMFSHVFVIFCLFVSFCCPAVFGHVNNMMWCDHQKRITCSTILGWCRVSIVPGVRVRPNTNHWGSYHQYFM